MTDRERLILILQNFADGTYTSNGRIVDNTQVDDVADCLLANGVIVLPCKVGDKIYKIWSCGKYGKSVAEFVVKHIDIDFYPSVEIAFINEKSNSGNYWFATQDDFGKTVFLTKEEAEQALKEREHNDR